MMFMHDITIYHFYLCNEGISILENVAEFLPVPDKLKNILIQIRNKNKETGDRK